jgi:hypothetical protein
MMGIGHGGKPMIVWHGSKVVAAEPARRYVRPYWFGREAAWWRHWREFGYDGEESWILKEGVR